MNDVGLREAMVSHARSLFDRGYSCGSSGNISVRLANGFLVTPTNSSLGRLDARRISQLDQEGKLVTGDPPSKEAFLHLAMYRERPEANAIVHLHSTYAVAVSCLADANPECALPPITAYSVMRVGRLRLVPYFAPGDRALAAAVGEGARSAHALLLANHGPVVSGTELETAVYAAEELEEAAKLHLLLRGQAANFLSDADVADLRTRSGQ